MANVVLNYVFYLFPVHPPWRWTQAGPGGAGVCWRGCRHPPAPRAQPPGPLPCLPLIHCQWVCSTLFKLRFWIQVRMIYIVAVWFLKILTQGFLMPPPWNGDGYKGRCCLSVWNFSEFYSSDTKSKNLMKLYHNAAPNVLLCVKAGICCNMFH